MNNLNFEASRTYAQSLDHADKLKKFRSEFYFPKDKNGYSCVYLCGNSLGLQPKITAQYLQEELNDWAEYGVNGHKKAGRPWLTYHLQARDGFAELTGSKQNEVIAMNTLTVNLHMMMATFFRPTKKRYKILIESNAFPSDRFAVESQLRLHGFDPKEALVEWYPKNEELFLDDLEDIMQREGDKIALMLIPGIQYYSGQVLPMKELCEIARNAGCKIGLDLAHAIGNVELELHNWGPDFAAWCTYKYLNGGPGSVGGAFVHTKHLNSEGSKQLLGWWSTDLTTRFEMGTKFIPAKDADLWQVSNPPVFSLTPVISSLHMFKRASFKKLREKSIQLTSYLEFLLKNAYSGQIESITPLHNRGCQLSLVIQDETLNGKNIFISLSDKNVIGDWREPNVIRMAPAPLYNSFEDVFEFVERLKEAVQENKVK